VRPERIVYTLATADREGNEIEPVQAGHDPRWPRQTVVTVTLALDSALTWRCARREGVSHPSATQAVARVRDSAAPRPDDINNHHATKQRRESSAMPTPAPRRRESARESPTIDPAFRVVTLRAFRDPTRHAARGDCTPRPEGALHHREEDVLESSLHLGTLQDAKSARDRLDGRNARFALLRAEPVERR